MKSINAASFRAFWVLSTLFLTSFLASVQANCEVDVCFAIDESSFLTESGYDKELELVRNLASDFNARTTTGTGPKMSAWKYGEDCSDNDYLSDPTEDIVLFKNRMSNPAYQRDGGKMNMYDGLKCCQRTLTDNTRAKVVVMLTGGSPNAGRGAPDETEKMVARLSSSLEKASINVVSVGVTESGSGGATLDFLKSVATAEEYAHSVSVSDVGSSGILGNVASQVCQPKMGIPAPDPNATPKPAATPKPPATPVPTPPTENWPQTECEVDVCFAIDESGSLGQTNFDAQLDFIGSIVSKIDAKARDPRVGLTPYSPTFAAYLFDDNSRDDDVLSQKTHDVPGFLGLIDAAKARYNGGMTNTYSGLKRCQSSLMAQPYKTRAVVLLTDGKPNRGAGSPSLEKIKSRLVTLTSAMDSNFINLFTLGLHPENDPSIIDHDLMGEMASDPTYFSTIAFEKLSNATALDEIAVSMTNSLCRPQKTAVRTNILGNTTASLGQVIGTNTVCSCSEREILTPPGDCLDHDSSSPDLCKYRLCSSSPQYDCDYYGDLICESKGIDTFVWKCNGALNETHCPCEEAPAVRVRIADEGTTIAPRPTYNPIEASRT